MLERSRRDLWVRFLVYPGHTLPTAVAPILVAAGLAAHDGVLALLPLAVAFAGSWLIHLGGVFADQYELVRRHPGLPEHPELLQALREGTLSLAALRGAIWWCFGLAALTVPYAVARGGAPALAIGIAGAAASLCYAATPLRYARLGLADPIFFVMFGIVAVAGTYYLQAGRFSWEAFVVGLPVGALVTNVLSIDDLRDREFDAAKGWRTPAVRFGPRWSRAQYLALSAFAYLAPLWLWLGLGFSAWVLLPLLSFPGAAGIAAVLMRSKDRDALVPMTPRASLLAAAFSALLGIGLALG